MYIVEKKDEKKWYVFAWEKERNMTDIAINSINVESAEMGKNLKTAETNVLGGDCAQSEDVYILLS